MGILEAVIASGERGLRLIDLADAVEAPKSSIHGLVRGLVTTGHLREEKGRYFQGAGLSMLTSERFRVPAHFHRTLVQLSQDCNESAIISTLVGEFTVNIDAAETNQVIRASPKLHHRQSLWPVSSGKIFLAYMNAARRDSYLQRTFADKDERARVMNELEAVRKEKVAYNREESIPGLCGMSGPIKREGSVEMTIGVVGPAARITQRESTLAAAVLDAANVLSQSDDSDGPAD